MAIGQLLSPAPAALPSPLTCSCSAPCQLSLLLLTRKRQALKPIEHSPLFLLLQLSLLLLTRQRQALNSSSHLFLLLHLSILPSPRHSTTKSPQQQLSLCASLGRQRCMWMWSIKRLIEEEERANTSAHATSAPSREHVILPRGPCVPPGRSFGAKSLITLRAGYSSIKHLVITGVDLIASLTILPWVKWDALRLR
eukprot:CAMPEP_0172073222 /NCGR_PEP_ID=MMETSP1043-20130122/14736_1 /TAXON_ID=464988 /ORGANISM="Hemiselmis andersenii, Strain CCMP441" /LENGTH=195 /DNA_ID=CAMNT_0012733747 /DNA_START=221 /DNA_END=807 /DNA_ORIENTATION=-